MLIITLYSFVRDYLTDFWKGFVIGALVIFFLMLVVNVYFYWAGKSRQATQPPQSTSASKPVTGAPVNSRVISIDEAKKIALNRVVSEKPQARNNGAVNSAEMKGNNWHVTGSWSESSAKSFGVTNFEVVIDAHSGGILKLSYTGGPAMAWG